LDKLTEVFGEQVIDEGLWPPLSPDINQCDFYLWGAFKDKIYVYNPHSLQEPKARNFGYSSRITLLLV
jgi:hypothetical protein